MPDSLVTRLIPVNSRMQQLAARLGIPQYQNVVIVQGTVQTLLVPKPKVISMTARDVVTFLSHGVEINQDMVWVTEIPQTYTDDQLSRSRFILDAQQTQTGAWVGTNASPMFIDRNQLLTWKILVKKERGR